MVGVPAKSNKGKAYPEVRTRTAVIIAPMLLGRLLQASASVGIQIVSEITRRMAVVSRHRSFVQLLAFLFARPLSTVDREERGFRSWKEKE
jgi:hypothetical protein